MYTLTCRILRDCVAAIKGAYDVTREAINIIKRDEDRKRNQFYCSKAPDMYYNMAERYNKTQQTKILN